MKYLKLQTIVFILLSMMVSCSESESSFSGGANDNASSLNVSVPEFGSQNPALPEQNFNNSAISNVPVPGFGSQSSALPEQNFNNGAIGGIGSGESLPTFDLFMGSEIKAVAKPVDIIFVFDESASMLQEKERLKENLSVFLNQISSKLNDFKIYFVASESPFTTALTSDPNKFIHINKRVGSIDALAILLNLFLGVYPNPVPFREASKQAIIITDDNATGSLTSASFFSTILGLRAINTDGFIEVMNNKLPEIKSLAINGLIGLNSSITSQWCRIANVGTEYQKLAAMEKYKGVMLDLCKEDWSDLLTRLAVSIQESVFKNEFFLSHEVDFNQPIQVVVDGMILSPAEYRLTNNTLVFVGEVPKNNSSIRVNYHYIPKN